MITILSKSLTLNFGGCEQQKPAKSVLFFDYYDKVRRGYAHTAGTDGNYLSCLSLLEEYCRDPKLSLQQITPEWVRGFRSFLDSKKNARAVR